MKPLLASVLIISICSFSPYSFADKPGWAGKDLKPSIEEREKHKTMMRSKNESKENKSIKHETKKDSKDMKELNKGSESGQKQREKRKKWWFF